MASDLTSRLSGARTSLAFKAPCRVATTANITLSGTQTIDGIAVVAEDRVLVKNQTTGAQNGIYVAKAATWERAKDFSGTGDVVTGTRVHVYSGDTQDGDWTVTTTGTITIGTTSIAFSFIVAESAVHRVGTEYYNVDIRHSLDSGTGDAVKIQAALDAAPIGSTVVFGPRSSVITSPITMTRQVDLKFHGTTWVPSLTASQDMLTISIPAASTVSGDVRRMTVDGLRWFWGSGGRDGIVFKKGGTGEGMLRCTFRKLLGSNGSATGYAFRISDEENHWNVMDDCEYSGRGIIHNGADGWKFKNCAFSGTLGMYLDAVEGAFETTIEGCTASMSELAVWVAGGQQYRFLGNSWEQSGLNSGLYDCQFLIYPQDGSTARIWIEDNFGGGSNVAAPVRIYGPTYDTIFGPRCTSHPGLSSYDVVIVTSTVVGTQFRSTWGRGTRSSVDNTRVWSVSDTGLETQGIWKTFAEAGATLSNSWAASASARVMVCPVTKRLIAKGTLVPGTTTASTLIATLPAGMRPEIETITMGMSNSGTTPVSCVVGTNGQITLNSAGAGTLQYLEQLLSFPVAARTSYDYVT